MSSSVRPKSVEGREKAEQLAHGPLVWKRYSRRAKALGRRGLSAEVDN